MCTAFSNLQNLAKHKGDLEQKKRTLLNSIMHVKFCIELCIEQMENGRRYFCFEHPASATSWKLPEMVVMRVVGHMCVHGMKSKDEQGEGLVLKPIGWATNSPYIARELSVRCTKDHRHVQLLSGRARAAQVYPVRLCTSILRGLRKQFVRDGMMGKYDLGTVCCEEPVLDDNIRQEVWGQIQSYYDNADDGTYYDDITGELLDTELVHRAIQEEMDTYKAHGVYIKVPIGECLQNNLLLRLINPPQLSSHQK